MFKRNFLEILRWGLRFHGIGHLVEVFAAISEQAYITATLALIFISIELLASFYLIRPCVIIRVFNLRLPICSY